MVSKINIALVLVLAALFAQLSFASTITLTGYCPTYPLNSSVNYFEFNISNSGNGTAASMQIIPNLPMIASNSIIKSIASLGPGKSDSEVFYVSNAPSNGSYPININVAYLQEGTSYQTVFPCIIYFGQVYQGPLFESVSIANDTMYVNVTNSALSDITTQIQATGPNGFLIANSTRNITVSGQSSKTVVFSISAPQYNSASFPIVSELSYDVNSTHFGTIARGYITFGASQSSSGSTNPNNGSGLSSNLVVWLPIAAIVVVLALIVAALVIRRKRKAPPMQVAEPPKAG